MCAANSYWLCHHEKWCSIACTRSWSMLNPPRHVCARAAFACVLVIATVHSASGQSAVCAFPLAYPGDRAPREAVAAWMAARASARGLPEELPVMAALVESGVQNVPAGDADSVGF